MPVTIRNPADLAGATVMSSDAVKLGTVEQVYLGNETGQPEWVSVRTGFFGSHTSLVPMSAAAWDGEQLTVPFGRELLQGAPHNDPGYEISPEDEVELFRYYGIPDSGHTVDHSDSVARDASGPGDDDDAMIRSEERLHVGTETRESGRARLRRYITSETVTRTVPVTHEELTVQREAITDANRTDAMVGGELSEEVYEITLHAERPVAVKETVPVERIRLGTETVSEQATVSEVLRTENFEIEDVDGRPASA